MNTFRNLSAALLTTIIISLLPATQTGAAEPVTQDVAAITLNAVEEVGKVEAPAQLTLINASPEQEAAVADAISKFEAANLELPPLRIEFDDTPTGCNGHEGLHYHSTKTTIDRIEICNRHQVILLHELAHAWKYHNLDADTMEAFIAHWGLDGWNDSNDAWGDRGIERAAHTIAFTLAQDDATDSANVLRYICGYELLTGMTLEIHSKVTCGPHNQMANLS